MNVETGPLRPGEARHPAESTQDIIARDRNTAPGWARDVSYTYLGSEDVSKDRYTRAEFADGEFARLWPRTWQMACREDHIPEVGDYYVYDLGSYSFIVVRSGEDEIKAHYNACLHRGTKLKPSATEGFAMNLKCPFHGWTWNLDGTLAEIPEKWDFAHTKTRRMCLPQARVARLGGFVWVNMDPAAPSLEDYLGPEALAHLTAWKLEDRYIYLHVQKSYPANWKLTMEAFMEAYHVGDTHPQVAPANGDVNSQYDVYGEHVDRFISTLGVVSPKLRERYSEADIIANFTLGDSSALGGARPELKEGERARQVMADMFRQMFESASDTDLSHVSDTELLDTYSYTFFPNLFLFPGISLPMIYRFRPDARDHRRTIYEVMFMRPKPRSGDFETAEVQVLADHQSFAEAEGMDPGFGRILDQDTDNLHAQQEGLEASAKAGLTLADYQEIRVRHFEQTVDRYMAMAPFSAKLEDLQP
ncbi:aromatic ring-hydroxylating oxygenase subunit alpha [Novosphingobium mangrovi (ex Hu et al. 2023)]|uniref:Aromatic ring-hydroxylating dioxygenase subunit alpha n=1 Tax=Novosphingobium mangrovi (ex Hu et al. 2023) TaxID=2930094 RepID=A0ABT0AGM9_9SPHN|nr:aromatic ring-hydroxylating dioxygenase subunit alpha [Novosphingobium mangrovi (ex Hu et al. 2023)]MCJ1962368.1 aromatic ring-hydroxylating dioxygenase subunit alpha [Novosphingobium mangrovi (ex Hu et al. 2023)]